MSAKSQAIFLILGMLMLAGCKKYFPEERHTFQNGDILVNAPYETRGFSQSRVENYFLKLDNGGTRERVSSTGMIGLVPLSSFTDIRLQADREKRALILDGLVFRRAVRASGAYWHSWSIGDYADGVPAALTSLRDLNLLALESHLEMLIESDDFWVWTDWRKSYYYYYIDYVDITRNMIEVSRRYADEPLPQLLVFSGEEWDRVLSFDFAETLARNPELKPPPFEGKWSARVRVLSINPQTNLDDARPDDLLALSSSSIDLDEEISGLDQEEVSVTLPIHRAKRKLIFKPLWKTADQQIVFLIRETPPLFREQPRTFSLNREELFWRIPGAGSLNNQVVFIRLSQE